MAKRGECQPDRMQEPTREATDELRARRTWFMGLDYEKRWELIRATRGMTSKQGGEFYRQLWIDAGRPG